ncbi:MAG: DUF2142 domain-containing protein, partial [Actinomycetota bacterium]|nr:DUF2142 domain-containing protein [Actinomycetota bacterium]
MPDFAARLAAVALGLLLTAAGVVAVFAQREVRLAGTNSVVEVSGAAVTIPPGQASCAAQNVPEAATSVRVYAGTRGGPGEPVAVTVRHAGRTVDDGRVSGGYGVHAVLTVPLARETSRWIGAQVCVRNLGRRAVEFAGNRTPVGVPARGDDAIRTDWLLPGNRSWTGLAGRIAERFAAAKPTFVGPWTLWSLAGLLAVLWAAALALVAVRARRLSARAACAACAAIAFANGTAWALVTPPLQVPDENAHYTYVQYVAERGALPRDAARTAPGSQELNTAASVVPLTVEGRPTWFSEDLRRFRRTEGGLDRTPPLRSVAAASHPPLYYVLALAPYAAGSSEGFFERLLLMRLLSCLLAALGVAFVFLFVREVLPGWPWAAPVAALVAAFQPVFGFMSGGVNNDILVVALAAMLAYLVARVMRRGLTGRLAGALALVAVAGVLTKTPFAGLLPGAGLGVLVAIWRLEPGRRRRALAVAGAGTLAFALGVGVWLVANQAVFDRPGATTTGNLLAASTGTSISGHFSYVWQAFLPRLPGMTEFPSLHGTFALWDAYVQGFVGRFGWWRFGFPMWANWLGLAVYAALALVAAGALVRGRSALRARWAEALTYV